MITLVYTIFLAISIWATFDDMPVLFWQIYNFGLILIAYTYIYSERDSELKNRIKGLKDRCRYLEVRNSLCDKKISEMMEEK